MTKDSKFTVITTPILAGGSTMLLISFDCPGSGLLMQEDVTALGRAIGPHIEQWLISYARCRNLSLQLPVSLRISRYNPQKLIL